MIARAMDAFCFVTVLLAATATAAASGGDVPRPGASPEARPLRTDGLTASEVLDRMARVYAGCKTYQDSGVVSITFRDAGGERSRTVERPFATAFVRPNRFLLESRESRSNGTVETRAVVWWKGDDIRAWSSRRREVQKCASQAEAFAGLSGVGWADTIRPMLLPGDRAGRRLAEMAGPRRLDDARLGQLECYQLEGRFGNVATTVWVDKATFLVRRVDRHFQFETFTSDETIRYAPAVDVEVPPARLEFAPPAVAAPVEASTR